MASRFIEVHQNPSNELMMKNTGPPTEGTSTSDSLYQSLCHSNGRYEHIDNLKESCNEYEDLELNTSACKCDITENPQSSLDTLPQDIQAKGQSPKKVSCGQDEFKISGWIIVSLIAITAVVVLLLNILVLTGVIGPKWDNSTKQATDTKKINQPSISTALLVQKLSMLERNVSSLEDKFEQNLSTEVKKLREKLSQVEVDFRSLLEALKQKDAEVDTSMKRAKGVEAFLNASVSQLKSEDGRMKTKMDLLNSTFMTKIHAVNSTVNKMQGGAGPPGPPGPQGPRGIPGTPGAGNLSQCQHQQERFVGVSGSSVDYFVNFIEPKDKIVVGATCSTERGDETFLSSAINSRGQNVHLCTCRGQSNFAGGSGNMKCLIDVWVCPRIS